MLALIYALFALGGSASNADLQIMLDHADEKTTRALVSEAARQGWVYAAKRKGGLVRLAPNGVSFLVGRLQHPKIERRIEINQMLQEQRK